MTCKGYDPKAVKLSKSVQRLAATIRNDSERGYFIKMFVNVLKEESAASSNSRKKSK